MKHVEKPITGWECRKCGHNKPEYLEGPVTLVNRMIVTDEGMWVDFGSDGWEGHHTVVMLRCCECKHAEEFGTYYPDGFLNNDHKLVEEVEEDAEVPPPNQG